MLKLSVIFTSLGIALLLYGCGFQLRGNLDLPAAIQPLSIHSEDPFGALSTSLRNSLRSRQVQLVASTTNNKAGTPLALFAGDENIVVQQQTTGEKDFKKTAGFQIHILSQNEDKSSLSLGAGAKVAEYQLTESVTFEVKNYYSQTVFGPITLSERKVLANDPNRVVSTGEEDEIIRLEMLQALAQKISRQLSRFNFTDALKDINEQEKFISIENNSIDRSPGTGAPAAKL